MEVCLALDGVRSDGLNLPYSLEAEQAVLGSVLMEPGSLNQVADILRPDDFICRSIRPSIG